MAARDPFSALQTALRRGPGVEEKEMFGAQGFRVGGKVFAIFWKGDLVLKLPQDRVKELLTSKVGKSWDPGHGRRMKEWIAFETRTSGQWGKLAAEAREFVRGGAKPDKPTRGRRAKS